MHAGSLVISKETQELLVHLSEIYGCMREVGDLESCVRVAQGAVESNSSSRVTATRKPEKKLTITTAQNTNHNGKNP